MNKAQKQEDLINLFNKTMKFLEFNKVYFKDWYNITSDFEKAIRENRLKTNYMLRYAKILLTSKVIFFHNEEVKIFLEKKKQLANLIEVLIMNPSKKGKEIYQEVYLKDDQEPKKQTKRK